MCCVRMSYILAVACLSLISAAGAVREVRREALRVDRRRGDDDLEVGTLGEDPREVAQQEVDVQ